VIVTNGDKGSGDRTVSPESLARTRQMEQRSAAGVLGVAHVEFFRYEDGELEDTRELRRDVTREIRRWRPDLIITSHPRRSYGSFFAWHRDHRIIGGVVLDSVYHLARDHLSFPELLSEYEPHKVGEVYLIQWERPQLVVDTTETIDLQMQAARCHASQVADFADLERRFRQRAATLGKPQGYAFAEGFDRVVLSG
jgi:LmbE family N-acetylglucosaminyl deacetylase